MANVKAHYPRKIPCIVVLVRCESMYCLVYIPSNTSPCFCASDHWRMDTDTHRRVVIKSLLINTIVDSVALAAETLIFTSSQRLCAARHFPLQHLHHPVKILQRPILNQALPLAPPVPN